MGANGNSRYTVRLCRRRTPFTDSVECSRALRSEGARAHPRTGKYTRKVSSIDSLSGAKIGEYFFTKQATGVVIGETATVGK